MKWITLSLGLLLVSLARGETAIPIIKLISNKLITNVVERPHWPEDVWIIYGQIETKKTEIITVHRERVFELHLDLQDIGNVIVATNVTIVSSTTNKWKLVPETWIKQ